MQNADLEWLFQVMEEPRRMVWRYLSINAFSLVRARASCRQKKW